MTIASEISRLQNDKAAICTAIENKGVTVGNVTLDSYAACIDAIEQGGGAGIYRFNYLLAGGGGGGGGACGEGGGGGDVCYGEYYTMGKNISVCIGGGGAGGGNNGGDGGQSQIGLILARGGHGGCGGTYAGTLGCSGNYNLGGSRCSSCAGGGGGGAGGAGFGYSARNGGNGGLGVYGYGGGGGGGGYNSGGVGECGGGNGGGSASAGCNASGCGGGGGGGGRGTGNTCGGAGAGGIAIICYASDGSDGISCATGGAVTTSGAYKVHTFTADGIFTIVE